MLSLFWKLESWFDFKIDWEPFLYTISEFLFVLLEISWSCSIEFVMDFILYDFICYIKSLFFSFWNYKSSVNDKIVLVKELSPSYLTRAFPYSILILLSDNISDFKLSFSRLICPNLFSKSISLSWLYLWFLPFDTETFWLMLEDKFSKFWNVRMVSLYLLM